jgi:hypothetical protein
MLTKMEKGGEYWDEDTLVDGVLESGEAGIREKNAEREEGR